MNHSVSCIHGSNICIMSDKKASIIQSNEMMISEGKKNKGVNWSVLIAAIFTAYPNQMCFQETKKKTQKIIIHYLWKEIQYLCWFKIWILAKWRYSVIVVLLKKYWNRCKSDLQWYRVMVYEMNISSSILGWLKANLVIYKEEYFNINFHVKMTAELN